MTLERKMGAATRDAYGKALIELGKENPQVLVLDADLSKSTRTDVFGKAYPERFIDIGIQESNLVGIASGLPVEREPPLAPRAAAQTSKRSEGRGVQ